MWLAILIFSVHWIYVSRREQGHSWPETIVTLLLQVGVLLVLGWVLPGWLWTAVLLAYLMLPWWMAPYLAWRDLRFPAEFDLRPAGEVAVPEHLRVAVQSRLRSLAAAGLEPRGMFASPEPGSPGEVLTVAESRDGKEGVSVTLAELVAGAGTDAEVRQLVTTIVCVMKFADGVRLMVNNIAEGSAAMLPGTRMEQLPDVDDPVRVLAFTRAYRDHFLPRARAVLVSEGLSLLDSLRLGHQSHRQAQVNAGYMRVLPDGRYAYTVRGAVLMSLAFAPPFRQLRGLRLRLRARRLMRKVGMPAPPAPAGKWWLGRNDLQGAAAMAILLLALLPIAALPLPSLRAIARPESAADSLAASARPYRLPDGFSVPADFPGAVRALERLAGENSVPLRVEDAESGELRTIEGVEVPFAAGQTDSLLARAAPLFRARGFLLFRHGHTFGIGGVPESVALYPRDEPFEVMALVGTNGTNYGIYSDSIVAWLRDLHGRQPYVVVGISHDAVEGRFLRAPDPRQARALAQRFYEFCPDVVTQGTRTTRKLAAELQTGALYCWWD